MWKKSLISLIGITSTLIALSSCGVILPGGTDNNTPADKQNNNNTVAAATSVYVAGYYYDDKSTGHATVWKDGVRGDLTLPKDGLSATANSIYVSDDGSIYVAGSYSTRIDNGWAIVWKNGAGTELDVPDEAIEAEGLSVYVDSKHVYVSGHYGLSVDGSEEVAAVWEDGVRTDLSTPDGAYYATARSIYVSNGTVYVAGSYYDDRAGNYHGLVWQKAKGESFGDPMDVESDNSAIVDSIYVDNGTVYVGGYYAYKEVIGKMMRWYIYPAVWEEEGSSFSRLELTGTIAGNGGINVQSVCVNNSHVYAAGYYNSDSGEVATVWDDGAKTDITDLPDGVTSSEADSIYISGGHSYVAGYYLDDASAVHATIWKDGVRTDLTDLPDNVTGSTATSVYVK